VLATRSALPLPRKATRTQSQRTQGTSNTSVSTVAATSNALPQ
jgi:hypothetical protein